MLLACLFAAVHPLNDSAALPPLLPKPREVVRGKGPGFEITTETRIHDPQATQGSEFLQRMILRASGMNLRRSVKGKAGANAISFVQVRWDDAVDEAYILEVDRDGIKIEFADEEGAFYAVQTLRQLLPAAIEGENERGVKWTVPAVEIRDHPRFHWRGMHLDVSRHFFPVEFIKRYIDYIAMMKMNVFHWHIIDDGGWRMPVDKYPRLTSVGAFRRGKPNEWDYYKLEYNINGVTDATYGGFYTKEQIRDVVSYAAERRITVVPEIEMPGHALPAFAAYPELGCDNLKPSGLQGRPNTNVYCAGKEETFRFLEDVLDETLALFPSRWIHIGGDEVDKGFWKGCPKCQARMKAEGLKDENELQSYFVRRIDRYLQSKGRKLVGWDEILEGGLAKGATVMSWRGVEGGIAAARAGQDVVMSPTSHSYFDYPNETTPLEHVYTFDPIPKELSINQEKFVIGGQANLWTEWIADEEKAEYMIFPRMIAMAETLWSPRESRDWNDFRQRLAPYFHRLDLIGANYYIPAPQTEFNAILFEESATVKAMIDKGLPATLRYTTDGSDPIGTSMEYTGPLTITKPSTVKFAYVSAQGKAGAVSTVSVRKASGGNVSATKPGWKLSVYEGQWSKMPDFAKLKAAAESSATEIGLGTESRKENFAHYYRGWLRIDTPGVYVFSLGSDDGSWLKIGDAMVVDNDGLHGTIVRTGRVSLSKGLHPIEVAFFQAGGAASLTLTAEGPGIPLGSSLDRFVFQK